MGLAFFTALLALAYGHHRGHKPTGGFEVNHVITFTLGFLFYWWLPGVIRYFPVPDAAASVMDYFENVPPDRLAEYRVSVLACYIAFALGDVFGAHPIVARRYRFQSRQFEPKLWRIEWAVVSLAYVAVLIRIRAQLFTAYSDADLIARGTLTAISVVLFSISLRMVLENRWNPMKAYFVFSLPLLAAGGRLYFVSSVITLLAYLSHRKPIRSRALIVGGIPSILAMGIIGVVRVHSQASPLLVIANVATESLFTSFSLFSYLRTNVIAWMHTPVFLLTDLYNLIPSVLVDKHNLPSLTDSSYGIASPMGAMNSWVSFNVNFGLVGTLIFLFLFGYLMRRYQKMTVGYLMLTGFTAFTFFRDPFSVSLVKNMLEFSILIPFLLEQINAAIAFAVGRPVANSTGGMQSLGSPRSGGQWS
jgi:hypothetical protein